MSILNILCIGDIVGKPGRLYLLRHLKEIQKEYDSHITIANIENSAAGFGTTKKVYDELSRLPIQVFTSGNHIYDKKEILPLFNTLDRLIRPLNFSKGNPGVGFKTITYNNIEITVINLIGRVFMGLSDCPFHSISNYLKTKKKSTITILDFHAETTSEKQAMGWFLDGNISCMFGTHTHVMTADNKILPQGTGYITDIGMVGASESILGMEKEPIIEKFFSNMPCRFSPTKTEKAQFNGILISVDSKTGKTIKITRIQKTT